MRRYRVWVPADCVASVSAAHEREAMKLMARTMHAEVHSSRAKASR
jgi:nicotinamidase-related amidase